jgi:hypothetical protein
MSISFSDTLTPFLFEIPPGKPDSKSPKGPLGVEDRPRVFQKANPSWTCCYYAFNMLRERYGKSCDEGPFLEQRKIEKICSTWRRDIIDFMTENKHLQTPDKFDECIEKMAAIHRKFFSSVGLDVDVLGQLIAVCHYLHFSLRGYPYPITTFEPVRYYLIISCQLLANLLEFTPCFWRPSQDFDLLVRCLKIGGPMVIAATLGPSYYSTPPTHVFAQIAKHQIYGWAHAPDVSWGKSGHVLVLVGAGLIEGKECVFYLDPNDASLPDKPRKVYSVDYSVFIKVACSINGIPIEDGEDIGFYGWQKIS